MRESDRYKISVRGVRGYLAGIGTSGSLLAAAAALFVLGSAIIAFSGWPQISAGSAHSYLSTPPLAVASRAARRLDVALRARRRLLAARPAPAAATRTASRGGGSPAGGVVRGATALGSGSSGSPSAAATGAGAASASLAGSAGSTPCAQGCPQNVIVRVTNDLARAVQTVGTAVGDQITGTSQAAAGPLSSVSPAAGSAVNDAGTSAGGAVSGTANTVGNVVSATGSALGGGH